MTTATSSNADETVATKRLRPHRSLAVTRHRFRSTAATADIFGAVVVVAVTLLAARHLMVPNLAVGVDAATFFYPMYAFLGERLRAGDIPGWNPHQFSGAPFAADPESGWTYLPAMLFFAALPLAGAIKGLLFFHLALAGGAAYALARVFGIGLFGALIAAVAYEYSALVYGRAACCVVHDQVASWLPLLLLCAELAIRSRAWLPRVCWWAATGFVIGQVVAGWLGQGAYYALLVWAGFVVYRTLLVPDRPRPRLARRVGAALAHGGVPVLFGFGMAAAGLLPRLEYNALSNLAGGAYDDEMAWAAAIGGWSWIEMATALLAFPLFYAGGAVVALAVIAPLLTRRYGVPFFALLSLAVLFLTARTTPVHELLFRLLPRFEGINRHWPHRAMTVFYVGPALLAGAAVTAAATMRRRPVVLVLVAVVPVLGMFALRSRGVPISTTTLIAIGAVAAFVPAYVLTPAARLRPLALLLPLAVVLLDLRAVNLQAVAPGGEFTRIDPTTYYAPTNAGRFLQGLPTDEPFRFFGYDPWLFVPGPGRSPLYRYEFANPQTRSLAVNNRAILLGLHDVQGYNPVQLKRYVEYMAMLNGFVQEYHEVNVYDPGLASPLLNLLNARYIVAPAVAAPDRTDLALLTQRHRTAYADADVRVLENGAALPRAWIVHAARQVARGDTLRLLAANAVDPRTEALLESPPPALSPSAAPGNDVADVMHFEPDRIEVTTTTDAAGLLVLSEIAYPAWKAYVDGQATEILTANHVLRAVPIPPGTHAVELRYESARLRTGLIISLLAYGAALLPASFQAWRLLCRRRAMGADA